METNPTSAAQETVDEIRAGNNARQGDFQLTAKEKAIMNAVFLPMIVSFIYAVFLPLQLGTAWLYIGPLNYLLGIAFTIAALLNFGTSPRDKVITKGLYRFSRTPKSETPYSKHD